MQLPLLTEEVKADVHEVKVVSCSPGTVLLWCGLKNLKTDGSWDVDRWGLISQSVNQSIDQSIKIEVYFRYKPTAKKTYTVSVNSDVFAESFNSSSKHYHV